MKKNLPLLKQNYNIIIVAKEQIIETEFINLEKQILNLLKKADLLNYDEENI